MLEQDKLDETQFEIKRHLERLDQHVIALEAKWGIGNLPLYVPLELLEKFNRQQSKLADAVSRKDLPMTAELASGMIRGWNALETHATAQGYAPIAPEYMEIELDGFRLRIAKNETQARQCTAEDVHVWSLREVARVISSEYTLVNKVKDTFPDAQLLEIKPAEAFDFKKGDALPF